jgi:sec-independent protein translocase protein TatA
MGDFGGLEWLVIILVIVLLFGAKRIPELARGLGKGISEFKKATDDIKREIEHGANTVNDSVKQIDNDVRSTVKPNISQSDTVANTSKKIDNEKNS